MTEALSAKQNERLEHTRRQAVLPVDVLTALAERDVAIEAAEQQAAAAVQGWMNSRRSPRSPNCAVANSTPRNARGSDDHQRHGRVGSGEDHRVPEDGPDLQVTSRAAPLSQSCAAAMSTKSRQEPRCGAWSPCTSQTGQSVVLPCRARPVLTDPVPVQQQLVHRKIGVHTHDRRAARTTAPHLLVGCGTWLPRWCKT